MCLVVLATPWLNPFSSGPSPAVEPWLVSLVCAGLLAGMTGLERLPTTLLIAAGSFAAMVAWRGNGGLETFGAAGAVVLVLVAASAGAALSATREGVRALVFALLIAAAVSSAMALYQYAGFAEHAGRWINASPAFEAYANLRQRNQFASLTAIGLCAAAWLSAQDHGSNAGRLVRPSLPVCVVLLSAANAATTSRTGLVQFALLGLIAWRMRGPAARAVRRLAVLALVTYGAAVVALPAWVQSLGGTRAALFERVAQGDSCGSRTVLWSNVLELIAQRPWLGWGWGELDYAHYAHLYAGPRFCDILDNAHNLLLHLAVELGVPAALLLALWAAWAIWRARPWRETDPTRLMAWSVLGVLALHSLVEYPLWYGPFQMALGLSLGLLCRKEPHVRAQRAVQIAIAGLLISLAAYAALDYRRVSQLYLAPGERASAYATDTLAQIGRSRLYRDHVAFAVLTTAPLTKDNAAWTSAQAQELLHFSPEPRVIERAIESAVLLGESDRALLETARYRAAFPVSHAKWAAQLAPGSGVP